MADRDERVDDPESSPNRVAPLAFPILAVAGSLALGIVAAASFGGTAWIGAMLLMGAAIGWSLLEVEVTRGGAPHERDFGEDAAGRRWWLVPTLVIIAALVAAGVIVVGVLAGYL